MKRGLFGWLLLLSFQTDAQSYLGNYTGHMREGKVTTVRSGSSSVRFIFYTEDILRIDFLPAPDIVPDSSFVVIMDTTENVPVALFESDSSLQISSSSIQILCHKFPLRFTFADSGGATLVSEPPGGGLASNGAGRTARFVLNPDEHFYGTGERGTRLDKRGLAFESYNRQVGGYSTPLATMNLNVPFLASTRGYAFYFDNTYPGRFDLGVGDSTIFSYTVSAGELSFYLLTGSTIPRQLELYTWLTGRQPLPPRWAFGYIQSKNRYQNDTEARSIVRTIREKKFPCDAIVLDLKWFEQMGDVRWDRAAWPDPDGMVSDFLGQGVRTILITEPYLVQSSVNFAEASTLGVLVKDSLGRPYLLDKWWSCGGCNASLLDITNPAARRWWWDKHPPFLGKHVAGLWTDLGEPERHPDDMHHDLGSTAKVHNIYNLLWAKTVYEGFQEFRPGVRVFNLTRSGFAGIQRYGAIPWSGDVARSFGGLACQLPMMLNTGMSGLAYQNSDIGGYARNATTPELYVRWMEFGVFSPIARAHGAGEAVHGSATEPWQFGKEAEEICRNYIRLRYRLLPYIYTMAHENYETGMPLARPLFFMYPDEHAFSNESSSYLWGDALLVSPVVTPGETRKLLALPKGEWIDFWSDEVFQGGRTASIAAPLGRMPLFVRSGSIIPMAPDMNYSDERPLDTLTLAIYPDFRSNSGPHFKPNVRTNASYTLYEDDGISIAYQRGSFALTTFTQSVLSSGKSGWLVLTIGPSRGKFAGKLIRRTYIAEIHGVAGSPQTVRANGKSLALRSGYGAFRKSGPGFYHDEKKSRLYVQVSCHTDSSYSISVEYAVPTK